MGRQRKFLQPNTDQRWFVQVTPDRRVYLGTKDRATAEKIGQRIYASWFDRDAETVERLVKEAQKELHFFDKIDDTETLQRKLDHVAKYGPDAFDGDPIGKKRYADALELHEDAYADMDSDRRHSDRALQELDKLVLKERPDLIQEVIAHVVEYFADDDPAQLRQLQILIDGKLGAGKKKSENRQPASKELLSECFKIWEDRAKFKELSPKHIRAYKEVFDEFVKLCGEKLSVSDLTKEHFTNWQNHVDATRNDRGPQWYKSQLIPIGAVLRVAKKRTSFPFPEGLLEWLTIFEYERKAKPQREHREPLTPENFKALIAKAEELAAIDVDAYAKSRPLTNLNQALAEGNNLKQANRVKRFGMQWAAILRLVVNVGGDNTDPCNLTKKFLKTSKGITYFTLPRSKTGVDRMTPLLPSTVAAIKRWQEFAPTKSEYIFSNDAKRPFDGDKVGKNFTRLGEAAKIEGLWYKHCRNVGGTVGRNNRRPLAEIEAFLGHEVNGQCVFYLGDTPDDYLVPLVNLIGKEYFDGETVS